MWVCADKIEFVVLISLQADIYLYISKLEIKSEKLGNPNYSKTAQTVQNCTGNFSALNFQWQFRSLWFSPLFFPYLILSSYILIIVNDISLEEKLFLKIYFAQSPTQINN